MKSGGDSDAFIAVFAPDTLDIVFATFLGGSFSDQAQGIALDPQGNIYVAGYTLSRNFPTHGAFQPSQRGFNNAFIAKISAPDPFQTRAELSHSGSTNRR